MSPGDQTDVDTGADIGVVDVDVDDEVALRRWWDVHRILEALRPVDLSNPWSVDRERLRTPRVGREQVLLAAVAAHEVVGAAMLSLPTDHNTHLAMVDVAVDPGRRTSGIGSALLAEAEERAGRRDRETMLLDVRVPLDDDAPAARRFAERHGYVVANDEIAKVADMRATEHLWPALAAEAAQRVGEHRLTWFRGACPAELAEDVCAMFSRFLAEIPLGDTDVRPQVWTVARLRTVEAARERLDADYLMVLALDRDGVPVGYTDVEVRRQAPRVGFIHSTLVLPQARGHRLGLAMKVRLHELTRAELASTELILTGNASANTHMNAVNEALGYQPVDRLLEMQKHL